MLKFAKILSMITKRLFLLAVTACLFAACSKQKTVSVPVEDAAAPESQKVLRMSEETQQYLAGKNICVVLGYGYNDEAFVTKTRDMLSRDYGVATEEEPGLILLYVYPDDFEVGGKTRISKLSALLEDKTLAGLIILGAPEGMSIPISKLQDAHDGTLPYPVFMFFPQDDVLASEASADFVLDYAQQSDIAGEEIEVTQDFDADAIIANSVLAMTELREPLKQHTSSKQLHDFVQGIVGKDRAIIRYTDIESGIPSANHFIFQ